MKKHTYAEMRSHYETWLVSGLDKKVYAAQQNLKTSTFYYWIRKIEAKDQPILKGFQQIESSDTPHTSATAVVRYPSGISIEWHGSADTIHLLKSLI